MSGGGVRIETFIPWTLVKRGVRRGVIAPIEAPAVLREEQQRETQQRTPEKHSPLLRALGLAHYWQQLLDDGTFRSIREIAATEGMDVGRVSRILRLAQIAPSIVTRACDQNRPPRALEVAHQTAFRSDWEQQEKICGDSMRTPLFERH